MNKLVRSTVRKLRRDMPALLPIRVHTRERLDDDALGTCELKVDSKGKPLRFVISIKRTVPQFMHLILLHEWAHARTWKSGDDEEARGYEDHGPEWALEYGRIYQLIHEP